MECEYINAIMQAIMESCPSCDGFNLRPSRWRLYDSPALIRFSLPLRCRDCRHRFYAPIFGRYRSPAEVPELVIRIRIERPGRLLRTLLTRFAEPPQHRA